MENRVNSCCEHEQLEQGAVQFATKCVSLCFVEQNEKEMLEQMDPDFFWIGIDNTGVDFGCAKKEQREHFLNAYARIAALELVEQRYHAVALDDHNCVVQMDLRIKTKTSSAALLMRASLLCTENCGVMKVRFVHVSLPEMRMQELHNKELLLRKNYELELQKRRYEVLMRHSQVILFDYLIGSKQFVNSEGVLNNFDLPNVIDDAVETVICAGIIHPSSAQNFRETYRKIDEGAEFAHTTAIMVDKTGAKLLYEIFLNNIFDDDGKPVRAICVMIDITEKNMLESEERYKVAMASDALRTYEANVTQNSMIFWDEKEKLHAGDYSRTSYTGMINEIAANDLHAASRADFLRFSSPENIMEALAHGKKRVRTEYRRRCANGAYIWVRNTMSIIRDELSGDVKIRCYIKNVEAEKQKRLQLVEEQSFYNVMRSKSVLTYEVNLSQNMLVSGMEQLQKILGRETDGCYSDMITLMLKQVICAEDAAAFNQTLQRNNVLEAYYNGKRELYCEYRRPDKDGALTWFACTMYLLEDPVSGDVKSFSYVEDINTQKQKELELIYKSEHDALTGLYDKGTVAAKIQEYLESDEGKTSRHAYFMLDIDYFKQINDTFGHIFGDAILSETARRLGELFRDDDILGRVGGDEFAVLMKNIPKNSSADSKASQICAMLQGDYSQKESHYKTSVSVGVAIYREHGTTCEELYAHADAALYVSKQNGRNCHTLYNSAMRNGGISVREIDVSELLEAKTFSENISEYVFNILYSSEDKIASIRMVLELVCKHYNASRAYIFENSADGIYAANTFEWCNNGVEPQRQKLQQVSYADTLKNYHERFNADGIHYMPNIELEEEALQQFLRPQKVKSTLQFAILRDGAFCGFIGFDQCDKVRIPTKQEITQLKIISNILGVFILEMRTHDLNEAMKNSALSVVNGLDSYAYVIDPEKHELLFVNNSAKKIVEKVQPGDLCHELFWNSSTPCKHCPLSMLAENADHYSMELYNPMLGIWTKATASWINWTGKRVCLVSCVDITEYKDIPSQE